MFLGNVKTRVEIIDSQPVYEYLRSVNAIDVNGIPNVSVETTYYAAAQGGFPQSTVYYGLNWSTPEARALFESAGISAPARPAAAPTQSDGVTESQYVTPNSGYEMLRDGNDAMITIRSILRKWIREKYLDENLFPKSVTFLEAYERALSVGGWGGYTVAGELMRVWEMLGAYSLAQYNQEKGISSQTLPQTPPQTPQVLPQQEQLQSQVLPQMHDTSETVSQTIQQNSTPNASYGGGNVSYSTPVIASQNPDGSLNYEVVTMADVNGPIVNTSAAEMQVQTAQSAASGGSLLALLIAAAMFLS